MRHIKLSIAFLVFINFIWSVSAEAAVNFVASTSNPADNGALDDLAARTITPPAGLQSGDLIYLISAVRDLNATLSLSSTGGQIWTAETQQPIGPSGRMRAFTARFNGTWSGNPAVETDRKLGSALTMVMVAFRSTSGATTWPINVAQDVDNFSSPASPFNVTADSQTTTTANTVTITVFASSDDNTWALQTAGWSSPGGTTQFRNTTGTDTSLSIAYKIQAVAGSTGSVTNRQTANGGDPGHWLSETFAATPSAATKRWHPGHYMETQGFDTTNVAHLTAIANEPNIKGVTQRFWWATLEPTRGNYNFTAIDNYLANVPSGKKLIPLIMDRVFNSTSYTNKLPAYLTTEIASNGIHVNASSPTRTLAKTWDPAIMDRLIALSNALAAQYDNDPRIEGILFEEITPGLAPGTAGFTVGDMATQWNRLADAAVAAWPHTNVFFNTNSLGGQTQAKIVIDHAYQVGVGVGGPDVLPFPDHPGAPGDWVIRGAASSPPQFDYRGTIPIRYSVQTPELGGHEGTWTPTELADFAILTQHTTHLSWVRAPADVTINWANDILPYLQGSPRATVSACPSQYAGLCDTQ